MYHPVLLQPEVLKELPALLDDLRPRVAETASSFSYRSEAFAEDLLLAGAEPESGGPLQRRGFGGLRVAAPLGLALVGAVLALFSHLQ